MSNLILVFDTETTNLLLHPDAPLEKQPKIIELGAALLDKDAAVVETFSQMIHPRESITEEITKITGITNDDLVGAPGFEECLPQMRHVFGQAFAVFAHNLPFDRGMMRNELARHGVLDFPWPKHEYCTIGMHRSIWGRNPKLIELYEFAMNKPLQQTHRALDDVMALVEIVQALGLHKLAFEALDDSDPRPAATEPAQ